MEGRLNLNDLRLRELPKRIRFADSKHELELSQKNWKIQFCLKLHWEPDTDYLGYATLTFDDSLKKGIYNHFKEFKPQEIKNKK
jgi:hypothetical protein